MALDMSSNTRRPASWPLVAAALSVVVPGLGQWYLGERRRGWIHLAITVVFVLPAAVVLALVFFVNGLDLALSISRPFFRNPDLLWWLLAANLFLLAFRVASAVDAYLTALPVPRRDRISMRAAASLTVLVLLVGITAAPHYWVARRNVALIDLLTYDFTGNPGHGSTTTVAAATTTTTDATPSTTSTTTLPATTTVPMTTTTATTTTTVPPFAGEDRVNVLLLGSDAGIGRVGTRTDTMIILSIDPGTGTTAMFSVPRNMIHLPIPPDTPAYSLWPDGLWGNPSNLAWGVYQYGLQNPDLFGGPNSGGDAAKTILGYLLGIDIDYFALVDLQGFVDMIDALGGVDLTVTSPLHDWKYVQSDGTVVDLDFPVGTQHMDGQTALAFSRSRTESDDYNRMGRQRCVLEAMAREADPVTLLRQLPTLVPVIESSVVTDIPMGMIPDFLDLLRKVDTSSIVSIRFIPNAPDLAGAGLSYIAYRVQGYGVPNVDLIRERVRAVLDGSTTEVDLPPLVEECGVG